MKFDIVHVFKNITIDRYATLFFDDAFNEAMKPVAGLKTRETLERKDEGGKLTRKLRVVPTREFPGPIKKLIDGELSYIEESSYDKASYTIDWASKTSVLSDKIKMKGQIQFRNVPGGVERRVTGTADVSIFGLGGMIEKLVVDNLRETYDNIARFTQQWIDDGKAAA